MGETLPTSESDLKKDVFLMALQAWSGFVIFALVIFWVVGLTGGRCILNALFPTPVKLFWAGSMLLLLGHTFYMMWLAYRRLLFTRKMPRAAANRISLGQCSIDVAVAQRLRLTDINFWMDIVALTVIILGTFLANEEVSQMPVWAEDATIVDPGPVGTPPPHAYASNAGTWGYFYNQEGGIEEKCIDASLKGIAKVAPACIAIVLIALFKYVIFCSPGDFTPVALDIEHTLIGKDKQGLARWRLSPQLRGWWALAGSLTAIVCFPIAYALSFSMGGTTGENDVGFALLLLWTVGIILVDGNAIYVTPVELLKLIRTLAGNALMRGAARVGASGGDASVAAPPQPASAWDAFEVYGAEEDRKLEAASRKGGDKDELGPLALMEPAPEQLARLGAGPGGRIRRFLLLNQRPQKNVVLNCYWTIMGCCLGAGMAVAFKIYIISSFAVIIAAVAFLVLWFAEDKWIQLDQLIKISVANNFGLVLPRKQFTLELARALAQYRASAGNVDNLRAPPIQIKVPLMVASPDRIEKAIIVSYRWTNEHLYWKKSIETLQAEIEAADQAKNEEQASLARRKLAGIWKNKVGHAARAEKALEKVVGDRTELEPDAPGGDSKSVPGVLHLQNTAFTGEQYVWDITIMEQQVDTLVHYLKNETAEYVWMDQFCVPQDGPFVEVDKDDGTSKRVQKMEEDPSAKPDDVARHTACEKEKKSVRDQLIPRMTALYAQGAKVIAFNNSGDPMVQEKDYYRNRVWCLQEYSFARELEMKEVASGFPAPHTDLIDHASVAKDRATIRNQWFAADSGFVTAERVAMGGSVAPEGSPPEAGARDVEQGMSTGKVADRGEMVPEVEIMLDWKMDRANRDVPGLPRFAEAIRKRVLDRHPEEYLDMVRSKGVTDTNDVLPALAQAWFGCILAKDTSFLDLAGAIVASQLSGPSAELAVIVNKTQVPESGTFITKRMLVGAPAGFEWGKKVAVTIVGTTAPFTRPQPGVRVRTARPWTKKSAHAAPAGSSVPSGENTASAGGASLPAVPGADGTTVGGPELEAGADASALLAELEAELELQLAQQRAGHQAAMEEKKAVMDAELDETMAKAAALLEATKGRLEEEVRATKAQLEEEVRAARDGAGEEAVAAGQRQDAHQEEVAGLKAELEEKHEDMMALVEEHAKALGGANDAQVMSKLEGGAALAAVETKLQAALKEHEVQALSLKAANEASVQLNLQVAELRTEVAVAKSATSREVSEAERIGKQLEKVESERDAAKEQKFKVECERENLSKELTKEKEGLGARVHDLQALVDRADEARWEDRKELEGLRTAVRTADWENDNVREKLQGAIVAVDSLKVEAEATQKRCDEMQLAKANASERLAVLNAEFETFKQYACNNPAEIAQQLQAILSHEKDRAQIQCQKENAVEDATQYKTLVTSLREQVAQLQQRLSAADATRRKLHNELQELKGNIRVFVRVRPAPDAPVKIVDVDTDTGDVMVPHNNTAHSFRFDKCFNEQTSQEEMFEEVSTFVVSALDGYNVSLFAYGQTGSGKTHTVMGGAGQEQWGIVPRAVQLILASVEEKASDGWSFEITASFVEIYNDSLRDLLCPVAEREGKTYRIVAGQHGRLDVTDLIEAPVKNPKDVTALMNTASENRTVAKTDMNERSSRSHMVFSLRITGSRQQGGATQHSHGTLHLVDLAGSERLAKSKAEGQQLKEAQAINKSLSALSDVFVALSRKSAHIPYRNSKLTHFLQPCLSGEGKALVIANLSPIEDSAHESLCTLRFASMVGSCELGKAVKHTTAEPAARPHTADPSLPSAENAVAKGSNVKEVKGSSGKEAASKRGPPRTPSKLAPAGTAKKAKN